MTTELKVGSLLRDRYRVTACLVTQETDRTYRAVIETEGRLVSIRQIRDDQEAPLREVSLLASLEHAGIPRVLDQFREEGHHFVVLEELRGSSLEDLVRRDGPMDDALLRTYAVQVCHVLEHLHVPPVPIVHRDLKPSSIVVADDGRVLLRDFSLARTLVSAEQKTMVGTLGYAPLEQVRGFPEPRSDLYALGCIMLYCLTGKRPRPFKIPPAKQTLPNLDGQLAAVIDRAVREKAGDRFASAGEMRSALLGEWTESPETASHPESPPKPPDPDPQASVQPEPEPESESVPSRGMPVVVAGLVALVAAVAYLVSSL